MLDMTKTKMVLRNLHANRVRFDVMQENSSRVWSNQMQNAVHKMCPKHFKMLGWLISSIRTVLMSSWITHAWNCNCNSILWMLLRVYIASFDVIVVLRTRVLCSTIMTPQWCNVQLYILYAMEASNECHYSTWEWIKQHSHIAVKFFLYLITQEMIPSLGPRFIASRFPLHFSTIHIKSASSHEMFLFVQIISRISLPKI